MIKHGDNNKQQLNEGVRYLDFSDQLFPEVTVDEYEARMGKDADIVTLAFTVKSKRAGEDLSGWFERGYDWVLDAKVSDGEIRPNRYLVFVEMYRRRAVPERICELLSDLETLCDKKLSDWTVKVKDQELDCETDLLSKYITTSPLEYKEKVDKEQENQLNEYRQRAGIPLHKVYTEYDPDIQNMKNLAGL